MKKGLLYRAIVIVLICAMVFSLAGFQTVDLQDTTGGVQVEDQTPPTDKPTDNPGGSGEGGQGETGEQPEQPEESEQPDNPKPEDDMIKVTVVSDIKGGTVSCENLPEDGMVKKGTELTFKAVAATEGVMVSKLVGATVNGKAVEVDEDGSFKVTAEPDGNKNEIVVSAKFFGIESVIVDSEGKWTQSKTVTVKAFGDAKVTLTNPEGKEITGENGKFTVNDNIGKDPVDYTVTVTAKDAKGTPLTAAATVKISHIDTRAPSYSLTQDPNFKEKNEAQYILKVSDYDSGLSAIYVWEHKANKDIDNIIKETEINKNECELTFKIKKNSTFELIFVDVAGNSADWGYTATTPVITGVTISKGSPVSQDDEFEYEFWAGKNAILTIAAEDKSPIMGYTLTLGDEQLKNVTGTNDSFNITKSGEYTVGVIRDKSKTFDSLETVKIKYDPQAPVIDSATYAASTAADANWLKKLFNTISGGVLFNEAFDINFVVSDGEDNKEDNTYASGIASVEYALIEGKTTYENEKALQSALAALDESEWTSAVLDENDKNKGSATVKITTEFEGHIALKVTDKAGNVSYAVAGFDKEKGDKLKGELVTNKVTFNDSTRGDGFDPKLTVMVTTPDEKGEANKYESTVNEKDNWVQSVKFEVNAQRPDLPENPEPTSTTTTDTTASTTTTTTTTTTTITYAYADTYPMFNAKYQVIGESNQRSEDFTATAVKDENGNEITDENGNKIGYTGEFCLGDSNEDDIIVSGNVEFTITQDAIETVSTITVTKDANGNIVSDNSNAPKIVKNPITLTSKPVSATVHVQNYLNPATVGYVVNGAENETQATAGNEYGWFNGFDNVLRGLNIKGSAGSKAPAWTYYTLTYQNAMHKADSTKDSVTKDEDAIINDKVAHVFDKFDESGYYTLTVWSKDAAGNETTKATYVFKYDISAPVITANFSQTPVYKNGFYKMQRTITVKIHDEAFTGNETANDLFALTLKPESGVNPVVLKDWAYTPDKDENQPGGYWQIEYTCGDVNEGSGAIGDLYKLDVVSFDNAGNTSITDKDGNLYKNGGDPLGNSYNGDDFVDFNIDQQKPVVSVVFDNNNALNGKYFAAGRTATITVTEHNFDPARVDMKATGATSGADGKTGWKQSESNKDVWTKTVVFNPTDANCEFSISVIDKAGNVCNENEVNYNGSVAHDKFVVDRVNPTLNITGTNATPYAGNCTPGFSGRDTNMSNKYTMTLTRTVRASRNENVSDRFLNKGSVTVTGTSINAVFNTLTKGAENDGIYKLDVTITDMAGNSTQASSTFTVNRHGSFYVFNEALADVVNAKFVQKADGKYSVTEYNASPLVSGSVKIEIYCDGQLVNTIKPQTAAGGIGSSGLYEYTYDLPAENFKNDGRYKIAITSEDAARNQSDSTKLDESVIEFVVDSVKPEIVLIKGLEEKIVNADKLDITANAIDTYGIGNIKVVVDGKVVKEYVTQEEYDKLQSSGTKLDHEYAVLTDMLDFTAEYTLLESSSSRSVEFVVTDMAGNSFTTSAEDFAPSFDFNDSVLVSTSFWARYIHNVWAIIATVAVIVGAAAAWYFLFGKKNKKEAKSAA